MKNIAQALKVTGASRRVGRSAFFLFLLGLAMSVFAIVTALQLRSEMTAAFLDFRDLREAQTRSARVLAGLVDAETAYRGKLLIEDSEIIAPFAASLKQVPADLALLLRLIPPGHELRAQVERLGAGANALLEFVTDSMATATSLPSTRPPTVSAAIMDIKSRLDEARRINAEVQDKLSHLIAQRQASVEKITITVLVTIAMLILGVLMVSFTQLRELARQVVRYVASEQQSREQIDDLSSVVSRSRSELADLHIRLRLALREASVQVFTMGPEEGITSITDEASGLTEGFSLPVRLAAIANPEHAEIPQIFPGNAVPVQKDFEIRRVRPDGSIAWFKVSLTPSDHHSSAGFLGAAVNITELKHREEGNFWLMRELSHRSQNLLAIVQAIARQTARAVATTSEFESRFSARLRALAATHDLLVTSSYSGVGLEALLNSQLVRFAPLIGTRIMLSGPEILLRPEAAQNIALALHELAANAAIHGALSVPVGRIRVDWSIEGSGDDEGLLLLEWQESGGPAPPSRIVDGFGTSLIVQNLPRSLEGEVTLDHPPEGTVCRMRLPMRRIRAVYTLAPAAIPR